MVRENPELKEKWLDLVRRCQASDLTTLEFARQNQVGEGSLYYWAKRFDLPLKNLPNSAVGFVELKSIHTQPADDKPYPIEISVNHMKIRTEASWINVVELVKGLV